MPRLNGITTLIQCGFGLYPIKLNVPQSQFFCGFPPCLAFGSKGRMDRGEWADVSVCPPPSVDPVRDIGNSEALTTPPMMMMVIPPLDHPESSEFCTEKRQDFLLPTLKFDRLFGCLGIRMR